MISIKEACKLATKDRGEPCIEVITDIGHSYVIGTVGANNERADAPPCMISKMSGEVDICFVPDHIDELNAGKAVAVPQEYKVK